MPKKAPTNQENIITLYRECLKLVDIPEINFTEKLTGDELRDFKKFCYEVYHNKYFKQVIELIVFIQCKLTADKSTTAEEYYNGKLSVNTAVGFQSFFELYANKYKVEHLAPEQKFDPQKSFEQVKREDIN